MKPKSLFMTIILIFTTLSLAACSPAANPFVLAGSNWKLVSYGPASSPIPAVSGANTHLTFDEQRRLSGNMGCNSFGVDYKLADNNRMVFGVVMSTMMACPGQVMEQEQAVLQVINVEATYLLNGEYLTITSKDGKTAAAFVRAGK